jgi:hypothetical protein
MFNTLQTAMLVHKGGICGRSTPTSVPPATAPQDLRMAKDYWLNGVQVKIWKGYVEGARQRLLLC